MIAINYASHSKEQNIKPPEEPYVFSKFRNALIGPGDPIIIPKISKEVDWEVELAVAIGRSGKNIAKQDAMKYVAGYTVANDVSFRDMQFWKYLSSKSPLGYNWYRGKGLDNALPLGPYLVTPDEISDPYSCEISLSVNGVTRQKSVTGEMLIKIDALIEYVSAGVTLRPGDLICTGTPLGVAAFTGMSYLKEGDTVEAKISGVGSLRNPVTAEI
jgi:2-keto-4-pentenoate hydratase/2-oxohepta-3-ene-1,7-dioic acid hydratase in catechol pathway